MVVEAPRVTLSIWTEPVPGGGEHDPRGRRGVKAHRIAVTLGHLRGQARQSCQAGAVKVEGCLDRLLVAEADQKKLVDLQ